MSKKSLLGGLFLLPIFSCILTERYLCFSGFKTALLLWSFFLDAEGVCGQRAAATQLPALLREKKNLDWSPTNRLTASLWRLRVELETPDGLRATPQSLHSLQLPLDCQKKNGNKLQVKGWHVLKPPAAACHHHCCPQQRCCSTTSKSEVQFAHHQSFNFTCFLLACCVGGGSRVIFKKEHSCCGVSNRGVLLSVKLTSSPPLKCKKAKWYLPFTLWEIQQLPGLKDSSTRG